MKIIKKEDLYFDPEALVKLYTETMNKIAKYMYMHVLSVHLIV